MTPGDWDSAEFVLTPDQTRQYVTLYESLVDFDERAALDPLAIPRLAFAGRADNIRYGPRWDNAYVEIGDALVELGRYRAAFDAIQTMVDTRPDLASYARVAYARELRGDVAGAERAMRLAFDAAGSPSDAAWTAYQLAELAFGSGEVAAARGWYARGLDLDPSYPLNLAGLAKVAWARGDDDLAVLHFGFVTVGVLEAIFLAVVIFDIETFQIGAPALVNPHVRAVRSTHSVCSLCAQIRHVRLHEVSGQRGEVLCQRTQIQYGAHITSRVDEEGILNLG